MKGVAQHCFRGSNQDNSGHGDQYINVISNSMGKKLPPDELELYKLIDEILWKDWDPIGVNDTPEARDEYQSYLPHIFHLAIEGKDAARISASLVTTIETNIGLGADKEHCLKVGKKIVSAKKSIIG
ncbi:hypothetical protein [uncultured Microbulbifer sp.]|uniref:hypothetical protein n=1 Tax=uncultured Microbulbifer sp. TaxID=348147 RepID=UPI002626F677|nr:hypothetical protein [uncultured Microbulbifer sp.]